MLKKYFKKLSTHPRLRALLMIGAIVFVVIVIFNLFTNHSSSAPTTVIPESQLQNANLHSVQHSTTIGESAYKAEQKKIAQEKKEQKLAEGKSLISGIFSTGNTESTKPNSKSSGVLTPEQELSQSEAKLKAAASMKSQSVESPSELLNQEHTQALNQSMNQGQPLEKIKEHELLEKMRGSIQQDRSGWSLPTQSTVTGSLATEASNVGSVSNLGAMSSLGGTLIKAGSILFAVVDSTVDSDQRAPVLATIVTGKYRGAKLLGSFALDNDKLVIRFNQMVLKTQDSAISVNAFAVDPKTAENGLATSVNHHYLERFGSLFAAGFIQGFGNSYSDYQNPCEGAQNCYVNGIQKSRVTARTAAYQGLGQVGTNVASLVLQNFNKAVTVKLKQGTGIGVLFMANVQSGGSSTVSPNQMLGNSAALSALSKNAGQIVKAATQQAPVQTQPQF